MASRYITITIPIKVTVRVNEDVDMEDTIAVQDELDGVEDYVGQHLNKLEGSWVNACTITSIEGE